MILAQSAKSTFISTYSDPNGDSWNYFALLKDAVFTYIAWHYATRLLTAIEGRGVVYMVNAIFTSISKAAVRFFLSLPLVKEKVDEQVASVVTKMEAELMQNDGELLQFRELPTGGHSTDEILLELDKLQALKHSLWKDGRVSGAVYHGGDELLAMQAQAYAKNAVANQLHPDVFPGVRKMEAEVVAMVASMFNAPISCGSTTSGGTELLLLAGLSAREFGRRYRGIHHPEVIAPDTVHAGIEKACSYFGMVLHKVALDPVLYQVDIAKVKRLINSNTVLLVGSAPNYPHGIIDDIEALSKLAVRHNIPLHVDACLGSFVVPFLESTKVHGSKPVPIFDFRLAGVTSISCDTHKYGFAPKGSSVLLYRDHKLRECQYYVLVDWTGGMYGSPTLAGSRPGALMAGCWATLVHIGRIGYSQWCSEIVEAMLKVKDAIEHNPVLSKHLKVMGDPLSLVIAFKPINDAEFNIYELGDSLTKKGWHFASLQRPAALHFAFTRLSVPIVDEMIADLVECTETISKQGQNGTPGDTAALYGVAGSVKTVGVADRLIVAFLDTLCKI